VAGAFAGEVAGFLDCDFAEVGVDFVCASAYLAATNSIIALAKVKIANRFEKFRADRKTLLRGRTSLLR
jgi:hypothetical protein